MSYKIRFVGLILVLGQTLAGRVTEVKVKKIEFSPETAEVFTFDYEMEQVNSTAIALKATFDQKVDMDNEWQVQTVLSMNDGAGEYLELFRTDPEGICDSMAKIHKEKMPRMHDEGSNLPDPSLCPRPKGTYTIERDVISFEPLLSAAMPGEFKVDLKMIEGGAEKASTAIFFEMS